MPLVVTAIAVASGCGKGSPTSPSGAATTRLSFASDPASFVGQGQTRSFTLENATFHPLVARSGGYVSVVVRPTQPNALPWHVIMTAPFGSRLAPGTYSAAYGSTSGADLDLSGDGRSCGNGTTSSFTIHEIALNGDTVQRLRASFTVNCNGSPRITGDIVVLADPWR